MTETNDDNEGLARIRVEGFASLCDVQLELGPLTVLIGPNGAGKSNLLKILQLAPLLRTKSLGRLVADSGGAAGLLHYGPKKTPVMSLEMDFMQRGGLNRYFARLGFAAGDRLAFLDESVAHQEPGAEMPPLTSLGAGHFESVLEEVKATNATAKCVGYWISRMTFFHFHDTSMQSALRTLALAGDDQYLRSNGANLPAFLRRLATSEDEAEQKAWRRINHFVQQLAPSVKELRPTLVGGAGQSVRLDWIDRRDELFGAHQLSDGTLRAIALITALAQPTKSLPRFISIDEPELGLHPAAIALLAGLARSVSRHTKIVLATQSTALLDHFEPQEVVVVENADGATDLKRLDVSALGSWLEDYSLSEVFDKGVLGGRP